MFKGQEFYSIIRNIFPNVTGAGPQFRVDCPRCAEYDGIESSEGKHNLEINTAGWKGNSIPVYHCWRCEPKFSGSLGKLIRLYGTRTDYEMYKAFAGSFSEYISTDDEEDEYVQIELPKEMILFSNMEAGNLQHFEAYNYLVNERKIGRDIILKYKVGFCTVGKYANRIIIPSYNESGDVNYFVGRTYDPREKKRKYLNPIADKNKIIFNEGYINWDSTVILVEGVTDMFSLPNAMPLLGKTLSTTLYEKLKERKPDIIILLDPDAYKNSIELFYQLQTIYYDCEEKIKIVKLPNNDDIDEIRRNQGIDEVIRCLYTARGLTTDDYFINKLQKPYDNSRRQETYSKYFEWNKSGSTRNVF